MCKLVHKAWKIAVQTWEPETEPDALAAISQPEPEPGWGDDWPRPALPVQDHPHPHRQKSPDVEFPVNGMVAQTLRKS